MNKAYDVIIVGTGVSGLFCALHLPETIRILMITKATLEECNSYLAQGGICVLKDEADFKCYVEDTLRAGKYKNSIEAVKTMIEGSKAVIEDLIHLGVDFDKEEGQLHYTKEAAHSTNRILHHKDVTGKEITSKLLCAVKKKPNVEMVEHCTLVKLIRNSKRVQGIIVDYQGEYQGIYAKKVVLATGGIGGLFESSTNFSHLTGDGVAIALHEHIKVEDINYIQIHPTSLFSEKRGKRFLISESVRGEGAYILNEKKERFVDELLPRDVVSSKIFSEMAKYQTGHVYLSLAHLDAAYVKERFPNIYEACKAEGYDLTQDLVPITPAQHYFMGGIAVDLEGKTSLEDLYALGETSRTGVHGANRLASNSLLEALVFAKRAARAMSQEIKDKMFIANEAKILLPKEELQYIQENYKKELLEAIRRKDEDFYARWFHKQYKCG